MKAIEFSEKDYAMANESLRDFENSYEMKSEAWLGRTPESKLVDDESWQESAPSGANLHIESSLGLTRGICESDDRVRVNPKEFPHRFICRLIITAKNGMKSFGSGFFISPRCVITSAHCVHFDPVLNGKNFDWAENILVIPGADGSNAPFGSQRSSKFRAVSGWVEDRDSNFDHGAIILPDTTLYERVQGYFGVKELTENQTLMNVGYPADKTDEFTGTAWGASGSVANINDYKISYMLDTAGGNSGSPVFIMEGDKAKVIGVHGYGGCPNYCIKVRDNVIQRWNEWSNL